MKKLLFVFLFTFSLSAFTKEEIKYDNVKKAMIEESIAQYRGACPCPYFTTKNGSSCGRRSAYSRAGGASVLCYPSDITDKQAEARFGRQR